MYANYHTHTRRCGHAEGDDRAYVERAVAAGLKVLGFSDHTPYDFRGAAYHIHVRMEPEELADYVSSLERLRQEYAGRIELHIGLEAEYYPKLFPALLDRLRDYPVEYLLLGQHFLGNETDEPYCGRETDSVRDLDRYVGQCIEGMQTGAFCYLAHPDLIHFTGSEAEYLRQMRRLCRAAKDCGLPLELNLHGLREGRHYPDERFWRIAGEEGNPVLLGCDAHRPDELDDPDAEERLLALARRCGLTVLEKLEIPQN